MPESLSSSTALVASAGFGISGRGAAECALESGYLSQVRSHRCVYVYWCDTTR